MSQAQDNDYISTIEAAKMLGTTARQLYDLIDKSRLPAYKADRRIVLRRSDVEKFLDSRPGEP